VDSIESLWNTTIIRAKVPKPVRDTAGFIEVVRFARRMVRELRNGFAMALRWLMHLGYVAEVTAAILSKAGA
jgi:hypothetical protein